MNHIRELRERAGITRKDLAFAIGISIKHTFLIERGNVNPSIPVLLDICDALGCSIEAVYEKHDRVERRKEVRKRLKRARREPKEIPIAMG